jgi:hypothetical protein
MSRRKKAWLLVGTGLVVAAAALFWPRENREARETLEAWRGLIEIDSEPAMEPAADQHDAALRFQQLDMRILKLCLNDATAGLFATPGHSSGVVHGRVRGLEAVDKHIDRLLLMQVMTGGSTCRSLSQPGQEVHFLGGSDVLVLPPGSTTVTNYHVGWLLTARSRLLKDGDFWCELNVELTRLADDDVASPTPRTTPPKIDKVSTGKIAARLRPGETWIVGGLIERDRAPKQFKAPLLSELPRVGGWFSWTYERDVEEEWIVFVRPSSVELRP